MSDDARLLIKTREVITELRAIIKLEVCLMNYGLDPTDIEGLRVRLDVLVKYEKWLSGRVESSRER